MLELALGRSICGDLTDAERREWIVANGVGGFAAGTVAGSLTRRYHGLLFAATAPPAGRKLLVTKIDETAVYDGRAYELGTNRWRSGAVSPRGFERIARFALRGSVPVWEYGFADAILEKSLWMEHGANTTHVRYAHRRGNEPIDITLAILVNARDLHALARAADTSLTITDISGGIRIDAAAVDVPYYVLSDRACLRAQHIWYRDFTLSAETERGLNDVEDHLCAAAGIVRLDPGETCAIVGSDIYLESLDVEASLARAFGRDARLTTTWQRAQAEACVAPEWVQRCVLAADTFIVARPLRKRAGGLSVIAGYPWFGDWGRDAMIALPGLTLATGRPEIGAQILRTFALYVDRGMLPNSFPEAGVTPSYNSVDAALWFIEAAGAYVTATGDEAFARELFLVLERVVIAYRDGTRFGIGLDANDGLLHAGETGVQLTWMDAKVGDRVITPRIGKPVEIAALWYDALCRMIVLATIAGRDPTPFETLAADARRGFDRFWNAKDHCLYDVLDGPEGTDATFRPNQLFAISLPYSPLAPKRQRAVVEACARRLLAGPGLRSLDPADPRYVGRYGGPPFTRDAAYHQGTAWLWLLGVFSTAYARAFGDAAGARRYLDAFDDALRDAGLGTLGELNDGNPPFAPRGALSQAWSVGEALRAWHDAPRFAASPSEAPSVNDAIAGNAPDMNDSGKAQTPDPREVDVEAAQDVDPKSGRSDDPRVDPSPDGDGDAGS